MIEILASQRTDESFDERMRLWHKGNAGSVPVPKVAVDLPLDLFTLGYRCISPRIPTAIKYTATR